MHTHVLARILGKSLRVIAMFETNGQAVLTQVCILQVPSLGNVQRMFVTSQVNEQGCPASIYHLQYCPPLVNACMIFFMNNFKLLRCLLCTYL